MKAATISELKKELQTVSQARLTELCIRLTKYKTDNKELLTYLLYESHDEASFIQSIKADVDEQFSTINPSTLYIAKKSLRKIVRYLTKHIRYSGIKETEIELLMYFCLKLRTSGIPYHTNTVLTNLFEQQIKKIRKSVSTLHEDLQYDYLQELNSLSDRD